MPRLYNFKTNSYEEIPEDLIREKVLSRQYAFTDSEKVPVIAPDGSRHLIPGTNALEAFSRGGNYGSTKDWARIGRKEEYGEDSWGNYIGAAATGLARGGTLGMSDVVLREILGKERMQTWREEFPGTSIGFEVGGAVIPAFFSGGTSAAGTGARLAAKGIKASDVLLASKGVFKGGRHLEDVISASRLFSRGANKNIALDILKTSLPKGVAGALEGAAFGAGTTLTEVMLGDPEDVGELLLANVGYSALFGGLGNAGINAMMMGGAAGTKKLSEGFASLYEKTTGNKLSVLAREKTVKTIATILGRGDTEQAVLQGTLTPKARGARATTRGKMATFETQVDEIVGELDGVADDIAVVTKASRGEAKREAIRPSIFKDVAEDVADTAAGIGKTRAPEVKAMGAVGDILTDLVEDIGTVAKAARSEGAGQGIGAFKWVGKASKAQDAGGFTETLERILRGEWEGDTLRRVITKWADEVNLSGIDTIKGVAEDAFLMLDDYKKFTAAFAFGRGKAFIEPTLVTTIAGMWGKVHPLLENASIWGNAAIHQKSVNAAFTDLLTKQARFKGIFGFGKGTNWTHRKTIAKFLEKLDDMPEAKRVYEEYLEAARVFSGKAKGAYGWSGRTEVDLIEQAIEYRIRMGYTGIKVKHGYRMTPENMQAAKEEMRALNDPELNKLVLGGWRKKPLGKLVDDDLYPGLTDPNLTKLKAKLQKAKEAAKTAKPDEGVAAFEASARLPARTDSALGRLSLLSQEMDEARFIFGTTGLSGQAEPVAAKIVGKLAQRGVGALVGGYTLGGPGAAAAILVGGIADGAATANQLAAIEFAISRARKGFEKGLDDIVERMAKGGPGGTMAARPNRTKLFLAPLAAQFGEEALSPAVDMARDYLTAKERAKKLADPQAVEEMANKVVAPLREMPNVSAAIKNKLIGGLSYITNEFKPDNRTSDDIVMGVKERPPTDSERMKMEIKLAVLEDPTEFLRSIENRTCTGTHADAMRKLYPKLYAMCEAGIYERVTDLENAVPFVDRQVLSIAFNRPFDVSNKPENITILQASYGEKSEEGTKIKSTPLLKTMGAFGPSEVEQIAMG